MGRWTASSMPASDHESGSMVIWSSRVFRDLVLGRVMAFFGLAKGLAQGNVLSISRLGLKTLGVLGGNPGTLSPREFGTTYRKLGLSVWLKLKQ